MILDVSFLAGRFHATPWGRHVNEAVPEWPPSPFRLLRAAVDAWYRKCPDIPEEVVDDLLRTLATPPRYALPRARAAHTRSFLSQNKEDPSDRKLVFDGFVVLDRPAVVRIRWPGVVLGAEQRRAAERLFGAMNYLGRSESWVSVAVHDTADPDSENCVPLESGLVPPGREVVCVAGVVPPEQFDARPFQLPSRGRKTRARTLSWLEALTWGSAEAIEHTMNRPPLLEPIFYVREADALSAVPRTSGRRPPIPARPASVVRLAVQSRVPVPITHAVEIADRIRAHTMGALKRVQGDDRLGPTFTGKDPSGAPLRGHPHATILVLDDDGNGIIHEVLVVKPSPFTDTELRAIDRIRPMHRSSGHPVNLTPVQFGDPESALTSTTRVESVTPFAPTRHYRAARDGEHSGWLAREVARECGRRGLPGPVSVKRIEPRSGSRRTRWLEFRRARHGDRPAPAYGLVLEFDEPVLAPFSIGLLSHFGLGTFRARAR